MKRIFCALFALLLAGSAAAQSLAEIAKKEKDRRAKNNADQTRTITENELRGNRLGPMTTSTVVPAATTDEESSEDEGEGDAEPEQEDPRQTEEYWRSRLSSVDQRIQTLQQQLQSPLNTNDPTGAWRRQRLEQDLAQAQAERATIVQEARRAGAPPGWLR